MPFGSAAGFTLTLEEKDDGEKNEQTMSHVNVVVTQQLENLVNLKVSYGNLELALENVV